MLRRWFGTEKKSLFSLDLYHTFGYVSSLQDFFWTSIGLGRVYCNCLTLGQSVEWNWDLEGEWLMSCVGLWPCSLEIMPFPFASSMLSLLSCPSDIVFGHTHTSTSTPIILFNFCASSSFLHHGFNFFWQLPSFFSVLFLFLFLYACISILVSLGQWQYFSAWKET